MIRTPNTFLVGAGPVATTLAGALRLGGVPVLGLWARRPAAARAAAAAAGVASFSAAPPDILLEAEVVILAVRDDAIAEVAATLLGTGLVNQRHVLLHCSGARPAAEVLGAVRGQVGGIGTLHPLRAISDGRSAMHRMAGTVFGVEGDARGQAAARRLVQAMGGNALALSGAHMTLYHAAAVMASNYTVALVDAATALLARAGVAPEDAVAALLPLIQGSLGNIGRQGVAEGLTGPIRRGDRDTVARHLEALRDEPGLDALYRALGRRTADIARRLGSADAAALDEITALLDQPTSDAPGDGQRGSGDGLARWRIER